MSNTPRVLFILKRRMKGPYGSWSYTDDGKPLPSGLSISVLEMSFALDDLNIENKIVQVVDNNCIDREVHLYKPTHVIIEAFWVVPEKFDVLKRLHPNVTWIIRNHSKSDFLSHEGGMVGWAIDYIQRGLILACNSPAATHDFRALAEVVGADKQNVLFLPNFYRAKRPTAPCWLIELWKIMRQLNIQGPKPVPKVSGEWHIGCFGAIRPLKNHLHQAMAAIIAAQKLGLKLKFYVNGTRVEGKAESILNSMRALFQRFPEFELVELDWMKHAEFTAMMKNMDVVMQVSNSETFNIVAADAVSHDVAVLVSDTIPWLDDEYYADPTDVQNIVHKLLRVWRGSGNHLLRQDQLAQLDAYGDEAKFLWGRFFNVL
jgi:hypothetical protein